MTIPRPADSAERAHSLRYTRTDQWPLLARFPVGDTVHEEMLAAMLACPADEVRAALTSLQAEARRAAGDLLEDPAYREALDHLPFGPGDRVVAVGDSITADRLGWFELLAESCALAGRSEAVLENLGLSGNTTADVLERFDLIEAARPTHVLVMLGTNDARCHGRRSSHRMVTTAETERNLLALRELLAGDLGASVQFLTPPPADQSRISAFFRDLPLRWQATSLDELAGVVRKVDPACIDVHAALQAAGTAGLLETDGVHPSAAGQRAIVTAVVERLSGGSDA